MGCLGKVFDGAQVLVPDLIFSQVGYWNEDEKFVSTAAYMPGSNDTYGLQNRTYIVTTILVCRLYTFISSDSECAYYYATQCAKAVQ